MHDVCLAGNYKDNTKRATTGVSATLTNPLSCVYQQVVKEGNFGHEQKKDELPKYCWSQMH